MHSLVRKLNVSFEGKILTLKDSRYPVSLINKFLSLLQVLLPTCFHPYTHTKQLEFPSKIPGRYILLPLKRNLVLQIRLSRGHNRCESSTLFSSSGFQVDSSSEWCCQEVWYLFFLPIESFWTMISFSGIQCLYKDFDFSSRVMH